MQTGTRGRMAAALILTLLPFFAVTPTAHADVAVATKVADRGFPAVSLVSDHYEATVAIPTLNVNQANIDGLIDQLTKQVQSGVLAETREAIGQAIVDAIAADPFTYVVDDGGTVTTQASLSTVGTAWTITPDGFAITAAHVVEKTEAELRDGVLSNALRTFAEETAQAFNEQGAFSPRQVDQLTNAMLQIYAATMEVSNLTQTVQVRLSEHDGGQGKAGTMYQARLVEVGEGFPGPDYAIIKIDGVDNLPTVPLGDEQAIVAGQPIFVVGFPASSTFFTNASVDSVHQPTITEGAVTALKSTEDGVPVFQTQAPASGGNSGGPAFNAQGESIGVLVAGALDPRTGAALDGQAWVLSNSVVKEAMARQGVVAETSLTTELYDEALDAFYQEHYSRALGMFHEVWALFPSHPYVATFITKSQQFIDAGQDKTPPAASPAASEASTDVAEVPSDADGFPAWGWAGLGALGMLGLGLVLFGILRRSTPSPASAPPQGWQHPSSPPPVRYPPQAPPGPPPPPHPRQSPGPYQGQGPGPYQSQYPGPPQGQYPGSPPPPPRPPQQGPGPRR
ncbi:MAG: serine protease [Propionibacteriaceae bacterium]|nr:serine protease [Propionibacteriaceae bacterium]